MKKIIFLVLSLMLSLYSNGQVVGELFSSPCRITKDGHTSVYPMLFRITSGSTCELAADVQNSDLIPCILERNMEGEVEIPSKAVYGNGDVTIELNVTAIGEDAFHLCNQIRSVTIPKGISIIGRNAFMDCSNLEEIICDEGLTSIDEAAFWGCSNLKSITLPTSLETIEDNVFNSCSSLPSITIPAKVIKISDRLFENCTSLESVLIKGKVSTIGVCAFSNCASLKTIDLPSSVTFLGGGVFSGCSSLEMLSIPDGVESLYESSFENCISLKVLKLGKKFAESIFAFNGCNALDEVFVNSDLVKGLVIDNRTHLPFTKLHFGDNVTKIGNWSGNENLKIVTYGSNVKTIGKYAFSSCTSLANIEIPNSITEIGTGAFSGTGIETIEFPKTIVTLDGDAVSFCDNLKIISVDCEEMTYGFSNLPALQELIVGEHFKEFKSNTIVSNCPSLETVKLNCKDIGAWFDDDDYGESTFKNVIIGPKVKSIAEYAFREKANLETVEIAEGLDKISYGMFYDCQSLNSIILPKSIKIVEPFAFYGCKALKEISLPTDLTTISDFTFANCGLTSISLPSNIKTVGKYAFNGCKSFASITFSEALNSIEDYAFEGCTSLKGLVFPNGLESIGKSAFKGCVAIKELILPSGIKKIDNNAFEECAFELLTLEYKVIENRFNNCSIDKVIFGKNVENIAATPFENTGLKEVSFKGDIDCIGSAFMNCADLSSIVLPQSIKKIERNAFYGCKSLKTIKLPNGVTIIDFGAFEGCESLEQITLPNSIEIIGNYAFRNCNSLEQIALPKGLMTIEGSAFIGCRNIKKVISHINSPFKLYYSVFDTVYDLVLEKEIIDATLYVPRGTKELYMNTDYWMMFKNIVEIARGDVNRSGGVDKNDVDAIADYILGKTPSGFDAEAADVNGDEKIDAIDIVTLVNMIRE